MIKLRTYQKEAVEATISYFHHSTDPAVIVLPTGAGKSIVIAEIAKRAKGNVLILAHVKELVAQNCDKYQAYGLDASIFSAGLKQKNHRGKVIFASVQSIAKNLASFSTIFSLVIIDECHRINNDDENQYQQIFQHLRQYNTHLRILGLTATPYRLDKGWIYRFHYHGMVKGDETSFFQHCIYELPLRYMIKQGYLTPPERLDMPLLHYDFQQLQPTQYGSYAHDELNQVIRQQKRITPLIIQQIIHYAENKKGVMIFAATVEHAEEIYQLLPVHQAAIITAKTTIAERDCWITAFKQQEIKYLVNVSVLTTGFDAPHVDLIAILRPTESVSLYQQIIGRGLRLYPGKTTCLILDYAGNPHDIFMPEIGELRPSKESQPVQVFCPSCQFANLFWGKTDHEGKVIEHYGRRCQGWSIDENHVKKQCDFRFRFKLCPNCQAENDIAAKKCHACQHILVDPDDMLKAALHLKNVLILRCGGMKLSSQKRDQLTITYYDEDGMSLDEHFSLTTQKQKYFFLITFIRQHHKAPGIPFLFNSIADIFNQQHVLRHPDFVIARKTNHFWKIQHKLFDYQGRYRLANQLR